MADERRRKRRELRLMQQESVWLQKSLFAMRKADATREKLAETRDEEPEDYVFQLDDSTLTLEELEEAVDSRVEKLMQTVREMRKALM